MPAYRKSKIFKNEWPFFQFKEIKLLSEHDRWRQTAKIFKLSKTAQLRLEWIIYSRTGHTITETARHFGISRKTFHKREREFNQDNLYSLYQLEDKSKAPKNTRQRQITSLQEQRIIKLRKQYIRWGKLKLKKRYQDIYDESISSWQIQKVIESRKLYFHPIKTARIAKKRRNSLKRKKQRITELKPFWYQKKAGYIICLDTITIYWNGLKRYIFTAVDKYGKTAFARMYPTKSSANAKDFLLRLNYLMDGKIPRVGHDNGSEFAKHFTDACQELKIAQYWSRIKTPKDNPQNERFNRTLQEEFIALGNFNSNPEIFNPRLTEWLVEYNFQRPHQSLNYQTPMEISKVLPMYSSYTLSCIISGFKVEY